ncbi:PE family protein, partial [Mycobacterium conspicuum]|uniref:PE family protein n=1 Tax=Mycobacterium conspicuum TaxID=44010 RepID=UPI00111BE4C4
MNYVITAPEVMTAAATDLSNLGSTIRSAHASAAALTAAVLAPGADEVSAGIATLFGEYAQGYHAINALAAAFHAQFVQHLNAGAVSYGMADAASAAPLQDLLDLVNAPFETVLGRPLIGNGADGTPGTGANGQNGGLLWGNGGNGGSGAPGQNGGNGGSGGFFYGNGGAGGAGGTITNGQAGAGGNGGNAVGLFGNGGAGGAGGDCPNGVAGDGGFGGSGGHVFGNGGAGHTIG